MKNLGILAVVLAVMLSTGCAFNSTKVRVRVIEHKPEAGGKYYALLCEILEPKNLAGRYHTAATLRNDLIANVDGGVYEIYLNFTMIGSLKPTKPLDYDTSAPSPGRDDFLDSAKRIK